MPSERGKEREISRRKLIFSKVIGFLWKWGKVDKRDTFCVSTTWHPNVKVNVNAPKMTTNAIQIQLNLG